MKRDNLRREQRRSLPDRLRHIQLNLRRVNFTLVGDAGRPWRIAIGSAAGFVALLLLLLFGGTENQLLSSPEIRQVQERGTLRVGVRHDVEGLNGSYGLEQEIAQRIADRIIPGSEPGNNIEFIEVTSITAATKLDGGAVDIVLAMMCPEMASRYNFSTSYYADECVMVVPSGTSSFPLTNITLGYLQSNDLRVTAEDALLTSYMALNQTLYLDKAAYASYHDLLRAVKRGDVDGGIMPLTAFERYREQYGVVRTSMAVGSANYAAMCASDTTVFAELASIVIDGLHQSGELRALCANYGLAYSPGQAAAMAAVEE